MGQRTEDLKDVNLILETSTTYYFYYRFVVNESDLLIFMNPVRFINN